MSNLLSQASLVMIPSGYKEDVVYSPVPTDGSGDLSFTRASNGTRVNSAGLVEVCPWNLVEQSEAFSNTAVWNVLNGASVTANTTTAPNGTTTADTLTFSTNVSSNVYAFCSAPVGANVVSVYAKVASGTKQFRLRVDLPGGTTSSNFTATTEWQRFEFAVTTTTANLVFYIINDSVGVAGDLYIWGAQLNIGSTAKPYFPTTDRLNVPRLTYQNGGGGCPSLLLEKQSTNVLTQSNVLTGVSGTTATANNATSPDGTQNAILISGTSGYAYAGTSNNFGGGVTSTFSAFIKYKQGVGQASIGIGGQFAAYLYIDGLDDGNIVLTNYAGSGVSGVTTGYEVHANGWYRFWLTATYTGTAGYQEWQIATEGTNTQFWYYGGQNEASSYMTSFIFTSGASATRVADFAYKTSATALIGQSEGTLFADFVTGGLPSIDQYYMNISDGSTSNIVYIGFYANILVARVIDAGSLVVNINVALATNTRYKVGFAYKANDCILYINGSNSGSDTSASIPACSKLSYNDFSNEACYQLNESVLFKTRLTNAELASLTTL